MSRHFILDEYCNPQPVRLSRWAKWIEYAANRRVCLTDIPEECVRVSTVFLGIEHGFDGQGRPLLFESMVFGEIEGEELGQWRYATFDDALEGHMRIVKKLRNGEDPE